MIIVSIETAIVMKCSLITEIDIPKEKKFEFCSNTLSAHL